MKHIRYITTSKTVCEKPDALDSDFIVLDYIPGDWEWCETCYQLVVAHNKRQYERDWMINYPQGHSVSSNDPTTEFLAGVGLASLFWLVFFLSLYLILWS